MSVWYDGKEYLNVEEKTDLSEELKLMRKAFVEECNRAKEAYPVWSTHTYLGVDMCVTGHDRQDPRPVKGYKDQGAHNAEGKIWVNYEYLNPVTGLFTPKSFEIKKVLRNGS
tara:strand:- start:1766 stop:2101 length:336 start_codon:yes stop_codon:yes gene_type:complete